MALVDNAFYVSSAIFTAGTKWVTATGKVCGNLIRATAPTITNERFFVCIASTSGTGQTGAAEPTWTVTRGAKTTDNTLTWQECTGVAALCGDLTSTPTWNIVKNTSVTLGQVIKNNAGNLILICTTAGTAGNGSEPSWAAFTNAGATTADNTVTWTTLGASFSAWAAAHALIFNATTTNWGQQDNKIYVADNHAESASLGSVYNCTNTTATSAGHYVYVLSVDHTVAVPPATLLAGASATNSGTGGIQICAASTGQFYYFYGISVITSGSGNIVVGGQQNIGIFESCKFTLTSGSAIGIGSQSTTQSGENVLINCTVKFNAVGNSIQCNGSSHMYNIIVDSTGSAPTTLFTTTVGGANMFVQGSDLSFLGSGKTLFSPTGNLIANVVDCAVSSAVTLNSNPQPGGRTNFVRCDSSGTNYNAAGGSTFGNQTTSSSIVRSGGATNGTTAVSWNLAPNSSATAVFPYISIPMAVWNTTVGSSINVTIKGFYEGAALPNNDELWISISYLGNASTTQASITSGTKSNILATASALTADTASDWASASSGAASYQTAHTYGAFTGFIKAGNASPQQIWYMSSHSGSGISGSDATIFNGQSDGAQVTDNSGANQIVWQSVMRFKQTVAITPQQAGYIYVEVRAGKASATYFIDPLIVIS